MSLNLEVPELFELEKLALHEEAKKLWNILVLQNSKKILFPLCIKDNSAGLKLYKQNVLKALPEVLPPRFPKVLHDRLVDAMIDIRQGYASAFDWITSHCELIRLSEEICGPINIMTSCNNFIYSPTSPDIRKYEAIRFIKPLGHFDDLSWAKLFVADENQSLKSRFYLACVYCFEDEIRSLWTTMNGNNQTLCEDEFLKINPTDRLIVGWWTIFLNEGIYACFHVGWEWAFENHHKHAAIFFWKHICDEEKALILSELDLTDVFDAVRSERVGFVHFIYCLLFVEWKNNPTWYENSTRKNCLASMMGLLLCSSYYKSILNDILAFRQSVPLEFYKRVLESLVSFIDKSSVTLHKENFKILWNRLSQPGRYYVLSSSSIVDRLTYISDIDLLEMIILPLSRWTKEDVLLNNFQNELSPIRLVFRNDFEEFFCYLLILLLDYDVVSNKLTLRSDAVKLVDCFLESALKLEYLFSFKGLILRGMIEKFKETLPVIDELINRNDCARFTHDFLTREIYPLLAVKVKIEE